MNSNHIFPHQSRSVHSQHGFALVIALSLMAFVLLLLLSMTTLVQVETTSAEIAKTRLIAQQNALTGALTALGELQQHCGVDQRSTASAGIKDTNATTPDIIDGVLHPQWMGVWSYDEVTQTKELETWLISGNQGKISTNLLDPITALAQPSVRFPPSPFANSANAADYVEAPIVYMDADDKSDGFAYWVSGQQEKADVGIALPTVDPLPASIEGAEVLGGHYSLPALGFNSPDLDPSDPDLAKVSGLSQLPLINGVDATQLEASAAALGAGNFGLLTNARDGGLRTDLTSKLETVVDGDTTAWVDFTDPDYDIPEDNYTTKSPTWGRLKAFYDLKDVFAAGGVGVLTPTPGTADMSGISPTIAMFSFGIAIGTQDVDRRIECLYQPTVVLHNPYNVPLAAHTYMLNYFGLSPRLASEGKTGSPQIIRSGIAIANFNYGYSWANPDGVGGASHRSLHFPIPNGYIFGNPNVRDDIERARAGEPSGWPNASSAYRPGSPRFRVESPVIGPGEAILFMPSQSRTPFWRMSPANQSLTPGKKFTFFKYPVSPNLKLLAWDDPSVSYSGINTPPSAGNPDSFQIHVWDDSTAADHVGFMDAILCVDESVSDNRGEDAPPLFIQDLIVNMKGDKRMATPQRRSRADFQDRIYQMTGRIPHDFVDDYSDPQSTPVYYDDLHPVSATATNSVAWTAVAYSPLSPPPGMAYNPYKYFNPRAKTMERADLLTRAAGGRAEDEANLEPTPSYFYEPIVGLIDDPNSVVLDTYGSQNEKVRIGGGLRNPVADTMILYDVPSDATGLYSLGQLQHFQVSDYFDEAGYAIGNSLQSPHIEPDEIFEAGAGVVSWLDPNEKIEGLVDYTTIDLSYVLNDALWDSYFFSTTAQLTQGDLDAGTPLPNPRLQPLVGASLIELQNADQAAANLLIQGAFNVNSTSVDAWKALLAGNHNRFSGSGTPLESPFFRFFSNDLSKQGDPWTGFSEVGTTAGADPNVDTQLQLLAEAIVEQVKLRGPFRSLAEFVNRRLEDSALGTSGALQSAIDQSGINDDVDQDAVVIDVDEIPFAHPEHLTGKTADGIAGSLSQADILTAIGPYLTTRSDTFTITSYGEHSNPVSGDTVRALLEMTVQRMPDYVDSTDLASVHPASTTVNLAFGRRFVVVGTRWLDASSLN